MRYQPQIDLATGAVVGAEALIRWRHPIRGMISPAEFIPVAENSRQIVEIGAWVLRSVAQQCAEWRGRGLETPPIAVNISPIELKQQDFAATVEAALTAHAVPAELIELEITEGMAMSVDDQTLRTIERLKSFGTRLAIDDFGSGYSSPGRLKELPVDRLKIDRDFIAGLAEDRDDSSICSALVQLGHALGLEVVAEGVETEDQSRLLDDMRCDVIQGFLVSPAVAADEFEARFLVASGVTADSAVA